MFNRLFVNSMKNYMQPKTEQLFVTFYMCQTSGSSDNTPLTNGGKSPLGQSYAL